MKHIEHFLWFLSFFGFSKQIVQWIDDTILLWNGKQLYFVDSSTNKCICYCSHEALLNYVLRSYYILHILSLPFSCVWNLLWMLTIEKNDNNLLLTLRRQFLNKIEYVLMFFIIIIFFLKVKFVWFPSNMQIRYFSWLFWH